MDRLSRLLPALLFASAVLHASACAPRVTDTREAAPSDSVGEEARREPTPELAPLGEGASAGEQAPTLGRAGAEAPGDGMPAAGSDIVIDWDRVRRHASTDVDRGVNVKRNADTGGIKLPDATPMPIATPDGAGAPRE